MKNECLPKLHPNASDLHTKMHVLAQWQLQHLHCKCNGINALMHEYLIIPQVSLPRRPQTHQNLGCWVLGAWDIAAVGVAVG